VRAAQKYAQEGKDWVADIDITKFFDHVNHDILMGRIGAVIRDGPDRSGDPGPAGVGADREIPAAGSDGGRDSCDPLSPLPANICLDALDQELDERGHSCCRYADDCDTYVNSQAAAERTPASIQDWIEKRLRLKLNPAKSGTGRVWERKFPGFRLNRKLQIGTAPESIGRFKAEVRELLRSCQSRTSNELRDAWKSYIQGWWGYFRLAGDRQPVFRLEGWICRHIRKLFWLRWHGREGRERKLRGLGLKGLLLKEASSTRGAWHIARTGSLQKALSNAVLRAAGFLMPSDLAAMSR